MDETFYESQFTAPWNYNVTQAILDNWPEPDGRNYDDDYDNDSLIAIIRHDLREANLI